MDFSLFKDLYINGQPVVKLLVDNSQIVWEKQETPIEPDPVDPPVDEKWVYYGENQKLYENKKYAIILQQYDSTGTMTHSATVDSSLGLFYPMYIQRINDTDFYIKFKKDDEWNYWCAGASLFTISNNRVIFKPELFLSGNGAGVKFEGTNNKLSFKYGNGRLTELTNTDANLDKLVMLYQKSTIPGQGTLYTKPVKRTNTTARSTVRLLFTDYPETNI